MAWDKMSLFSNKDKKDAQEKENAVKDVKDIEKKVEDAKPAEKSIAEQIAESLKPLTDSMATLTQQVTELRTPPKVETPAERKSVLDDEDAAFNQRLTPILAKTFEMEAKMAKVDVEAEYRKEGLGDLWEANRKEIDEFLDSSALVAQNSEGKTVPLRGNPEYIRNVADMVIGRTARKSGIRFDGKDKKFFLEDASGESGLEQRKFIEEKGLTHKQLEAAKRFGIPVSEYRKAASKLDFVDRN